MKNSIEISKVLLEMLNQASFPGSQRNMVMVVAKWLEDIRDGALVVVESSSTEKGSD